MNGATVEKNNEESLRPKFTTAKSQATLQVLSNPTCTFSPRQLNSVFLTQTNKEFDLQDFFNYKPAVRPKTSEKIR